MSKKDGWGCSIQGNTVTPSSKVVYPYPVDWEINGACIGKIIVKERVGSVELTYILDNDNPRVTDEMREMAKRMVATASEVLEKDA